MTSWGVLLADGPRFAFLAAVAASVFSSAVVLLAVVRDRWKGAAPKYPKYYTKGRVEDSYVSSRVWRRWSAREKALLAEYIARQGACLQTVTGKTTGVRQLGLWFSKGAWLNMCDLKFVRKHEITGTALEVQNLHAG